MPFAIFREMSDNDLHESAVHLAEQDRKITLALLKHLNEIERRHLYSRFSVSSLHGYCVKELKMDEGTAGRRVSAARLLRELPALEEKISSGAVTLTSIAQAGIFFRKESKIGNSFSSDEKSEIIFKLENKSTRDVEKLLMANSDQPEIHFKERVTQKTKTRTEVTVHLDEETMAALQRLKEIWSHANPHANFGDVIKRAATEAVAKHDSITTSAPKSARGKMPRAEIKRQIWRRDQSQCTFEDPRTGERCRARRFIEDDHVIPESMGGEYSLENVRLRCRTHNQRHAIDCFGAEKMRRHLPSMNW